MITVIENRTKFLNGSKKSVVKKRGLSQQLGRLLNYLPNAVQYYEVQYIALQYNAVLCTVVNQGDINHFTILVLAMRAKYFDRRRCIGPLSVDCRVEFMTI